MSARFIFVLCAASILAACGPGDGGEEERSAVHASALVKGGVQWVLWPAREGRADLWLTDANSSTQAFAAFSCTPGDRRLAIRTDMFQRPGPGDAPQRLTVQGGYTVEGRVRWPPLENISQGRVSVAVTRADLSRLLAGPMIEFRIDPARYAFPGPGEVGEAFARRCAQALKLPQ